MIAALKLTLSWFLEVHLFIEFSLFTTKNTSYFLCNDHKGTKCLLETISDRLDEIIRGKHIGFLLSNLALEHILPNLIGGHEKP